MKNPYEEQGRRFRLLRLAEGIPSQSAFARKFDWHQVNVSQFETGLRSVPRDKAMELKRSIPGFDPRWLWEGEESGLSFDLRKRITEQAKNHDLETDVGQRNGKLPKTTLAPRRSRCRYERTGVRGRPT
jgi:hypothetical protein